MMEMGQCLVRDWWELYICFLAFSDLVAFYRFCEANCCFLLVSWCTISLYRQCGNSGVLLYLDMLGLYSGFGWLAVGRIFGLGARFGVYEILTAFSKGNSFCFSLKSLVWLVFFCFRLLININEIEWDYFLLIAYAWNMFLFISIT